MAYLAAAKAQLGDYRAESARALLERGLPQWRASRRICSRSRACTARRCHDLGAIPEALQSFARALELAPDDAGRCQAWLGLAACKRMTDDFGGAQADLELAEAAATRLGPRLTCWRAATFSPAISASRAAISRAACVTTAKAWPSLGRAAPRSTRRRRSAASGDADYVRGRMISAQAHYERCLALCRDARDWGASRPRIGRCSASPASSATTCAARSPTPWRPPRSARHIGQPRGEMVAHMVAAEMCANLMSLDGRAGASRRGGAADRPARCRTVRAVAAQLPREDAACHGSTCRGAAAAAAVGRGQPRDLARRSAARPRSGALALTTDDPDERRTRDRGGRGAAARRVGGAQPFPLLPRHDRRRPARRGLGRGRASGRRRWPRSQPPSRCPGPTSTPRAAARWPPGVAASATNPNGLSCDRLAEQARAAGLLLALPAIEVALAR